MAPPAVSLRAVSMPIEEMDVLDAAAGLGPLTLYLEQPQAGAARAGVGGVAELRARGPAEVAPLLEQLTSPQSAVQPLDALSTDVPGPWFGGMDFDAREERSEAWAGFGSARWVVPAYLLWRDPGRPLRLTRFLTPEETPAAARAALEGAASRLAVLPGPTRTELPPAARVVGAGQEGYLRAVEAAVRAIRSGELLKVMVARAVDVEAAGPFDDAALLRKLRARFPSCAAFLFRGSDGSAFLGATPETLCRFEGPTLVTEALAGTSSPAGAEELLRSVKDLHEHRAVVDGIRTALRPFASELDAPETPGLKRLPNLAHLYTPIRASLKAGVQITDVVSALHPTPSVGGTPRGRALDFLVASEGLARGWYAGPVGALGPAGVELFVALRCALVRGASARIFVGAGIVEGSVPASELRETSLKARVLLDALGLERITDV